MHSVFLIYVRLFNVVPYIDNSYKIVKIFEKNYMQSEFNHYMNAANRFYPSISVFSFQETEIRRWMLTFYFTETYI